MITKELIIKDFAEIVDKWDYNRKTKTPALILAASLYDYLEEFIHIQNYIKDDNS